MPVLSFFILTNRRRCGDRVLVRWEHVCSAVQIMASAVSPDRGDSRCRLSAVRSSSEWLRQINQLQLSTEMTGHLASAAEINTSSLHLSQVRIIQVYTLCWVKPDCLVLSSQSARQNKSWTRAGNTNWLVFEYHIIIKTDSSYIMTQLMEAIEGSYTKFIK